MTGMLLLAKDSNAVFAAYFPNLSRSYSPSYAIRYLTKSPNIFLAYDSTKSVERLNPESTAAAFTSG